MDDLFRSFFGFPNKSGMFDNNRRIHDDDNAEEEERSSFQKSDDDRNTEHFSFDNSRSFMFIQPGDIFRHFDEMFSGFDNMFGGFAVEEIPSIMLPEDDNSNPPSIQPPLNRRSLRDRMLKQPEDTQIPERRASDDDKFNNRRTSPGFFGSLLPFQSSDKKGDTDMDDLIKSRGLNGILAEPSDVVPAPRLRSAFKSISVQTRRMPDGKVEERRTSVDSAGNQETLVTRSMDGQTHQQTIRKNRLGQEEIAENFTNLSEQEKSDFEKKWNAPSQSPASPLYASPRREDAVQDRETASIFGRLFGFDFPQSGFK